MKINFPERIVCLTEESVETLFSIGEGHRVVGVSAFAKRPKEIEGLPIVCAFTGGNVKKIREQRPDLILGFSDIQKDLARDLIAQGEDVYISNHRSLEGILRYIKTLGYMVGAVDKTELFLKELEDKIEEAKRFASTLKIRPRVYIEEWDEPMICGIQWFSELVELCGGVSVTKEKSSGSLASDRFVTNDEIAKLDPDLILACWCGKPVDMDSIYARSELQNTPAIKNRMVFELDPVIFLQPGPAPIVAGIDTLIQILSSASFAE